MKTYFTCFTLLLFVSSCGSKIKTPTDLDLSNFEIIDLSSKELSLLNEYENMPIERRDSILLDSIYYPNSYLWKGYLGSETDFINWVNNTVYDELVIYNKKAEKINLIELNNYFKTTAKNMTLLTGHQPKGKWYMFFGPKWTNLGGFSDGTMLIDLAHNSINNLEDITTFFPHELNHQIYSNTVVHTQTAVLNRILDEGFACYVGNLYHNNRITIAEELGYSEAEYSFCRTNDKEIIGLLKENQLSNDEELARNFADRGYTFSDNYPSAIGYYIGFRIVEEYVKENGKDSWKKIFTMKPEEVLTGSKIIQ